MPVQKAGQKRKVVEIPRLEDVSGDAAFANGDLDDAFSSDDHIDEIEPILDDDEPPDEESESDGDEEEDDEAYYETDDDEFSESENEDGVRQQLHKLTTDGASATLQESLGVDSAGLRDKASMTASASPLDDEPRDLTNYRLDVDANGNPRYIYNEIEPVYDSDDSDAPATTNTIGNIPLSYYDAYPHIGYDINGRRIARPAKGEALDSLLDSIDLPEGWTGLTDPATGKPLQLSSEELDTLKKLARNEAPGEGYDPYPDMVEYFTGKGMEEIMPITAAPEPKRRFVPSMYEHKRVMKMVKAIKDGRIKPFHKPTEEEQEREEDQQDYASYDIWTNETLRPDHPMNVPAPKLMPPIHEESYHPPPEYLPDQQEREEWEQQDEEDRERDFLPRDHSALRRVPGYDSFVKDKFERCLDLYLAPRVRRSKLNIDPESLLPKLPDPSELKPFPTACHVTYTGHEGRVRSVAIDFAGQHVVSGGDDGTVRIWDLKSGRQLWRVKLSATETVNVVSWRPGGNTSIVAACCGDVVYFIIPQGELCSPEVESASRDVLDAGFGYAASSNQSQASDKKSTTWARPPASLQDKGVLLTLTLRSAPKTLAWHRRGEYFSTVSPSTSATSTAVAIHTMSKHQTQYPFRRLKGLAQTVCFHPSKPHFFVATRQRIRRYDLQEQKLEKELQPGARWISAISLHPMGENLLVSSYDKRLLWHDLELGATPYKTLRYHDKAIRSVKFHSSLPLFVDASDDGSLQVFHGKIVADSMENATIVPLKVLRGHKIKSDLGVLDVDWHPREAWAVSAGADGKLRLWA